MLRFFSIFFSARGSNQWIVLVCLIVGSIAQAIGLLTLVPLLNVANESGGASQVNQHSDNQINVVIVNALASIGLPATFEVLLVIVVLGTAVKAGLAMVAMTRVGYAVAEVATELRVRLIEALLKVRWSYFVSQPLGSIANAISLDATRSANAYSMVAQVLSYGILSVCYVIVAFIVSWRVSLVAIGMALVTTFALQSYVRVSKRAGNKQTVRTRELLTNLSDTLIGIKAIKAMNRHGRFSELFAKQTSSLNKALRKQVISKEALKNLQELLTAVCLAVGLYVARKIWQTPINDLIVIAIAIGSTISSITKVQKQLQLAVIDESAYHSVHDMIEEAIAEAERRRPGRRPTLGRACKLEEVSFAFGERRVLNNVTIEVPARRLTVITGGSGAGKTTLIDLLIGLHEPDRGRVTIDGVPLPELDIEAWRSMVGYVPQELALFHDTVLHNITLGDPKFSEDDVRGALRAAGAEAFVDALPGGLSMVVGERGMRTSGGQRQRIALARALVHRPKLLILDEVTSALDPDTEKAICNNVKALIEKSGETLTVLAITHRAAWLEEADVVYHLSGDGVVTAVDRSDRVVATTSA